MATANTRTNINTTRTKPLIRLGADYLVVLIASVALVVMTTGQIAPVRSAPTTTTTSKTTTTGLVTTSPTTGMKQIPSLILLIIHQDDDDILTDID